jgi:hypothetical protein
MIKPRIQCFATRHNFSFRRIFRDGIETLLIFVVSLVDWLHQLRFVGDYATRLWSVMVALMFGERLFFWEEQSFQAFA